MRTPFPRIWRAITALTLALLIYCLDRLLNALPNPLFVVMAGAVLGRISELRSSPNRQLINTPLLPTYRSGKGPITRPDRHSS